MLYLGIYLYLYLGIYLGIQVRTIISSISYVRKEKCCPAPAPVYVKLRQPPWIMKRGGLESFGKRLISLNSKSKRVEYFKFCIFLLLFLFNFFMFLFETFLEIIH